MPACVVAGCRFADTHLTISHRCGQCGGFGHGVLECTDPDAKAALRGRRTQTVLFHCAVPGCALWWAHATVAHHCRTCGARGGSCSCGTAQRAAQRARCPICTQEGPVDLARPLYTGGTCAVCFEAGPLVLFEGCRHAQTCAACVRRL